MASSPPVADGAVVGSTPAPAVPPFPTVNSILSKDRIAARRFRIANRGEEEKLASLDLDPFAPKIMEYVSKSHEQICQSRLKLLQLMERGGQKESDVRVLSDGKMKDHEVLQTEMTRSRREEMEKEAAADEERMTAILAKWEDRFKTERAHPMHDLWLQQKNRCEEVIATKDDLIVDMRNEIQRREGIFNLDLDGQGSDIQQLIARINDTIVNMRKTYREELNAIEDAFYEDRKNQMMQIRDEAQERWHQRAKLEKKWDRERLHRVQDNAEEIVQIRTAGVESFNQVKRTLDSDTLILEQDLNHMKACQMLNNEKLDYNLQVLRRRDEENARSKSTNSARIANQNTKLHQLQKQNKVMEEKTQKVLNSLEKDIQKFTRETETVSLRYLEFMKHSDNTFRDVWLMNEEECQILVDDIKKCDCILDEQQLGKTREDSLEEKNQEDPLSSDSVLEINIEPDSRNDQRCADVPVPNAVPNADDLDLSQVQRFQKNLFNSLSMSTIDAVTQLLCDESGFLVEDRIQKIIDPKPAHEQHLVTMDAVFEALNITKEADILALTKYFFMFRQMEEEKSQEENGDAGSGNLNKKAESEGVSLHVHEYDGISLHVNESNYSSVIHVRVEECSTPSTSLSWHPPDEFRTSYRRSPSSPGILSREELFDAMARPLTSKSKTPHVNDPASFTDFVDVQAKDCKLQLIHPNQVVGALKAFVQSLPRYRRNSIELEEEIHLPSLDMEATRNNHFLEEEQERKLEDKVTLLLVRLEKKKSERTRDSKGDTSYWRSLRKAIPDERLNMWKGLQFGMEQMNVTLTARAKLKKETDDIKQQNEELRGMLQQYMQSTVNQVLKVPPKEVLHYGPP